MDTWIPGTNLKRSLVQGCFADFARSETGAAGSGSAGAGAAASGAAGARAAGAGADGAAATETGAAGAGDAGTGDAGAGRLLCYFHIRNRFEETLQNKCFKSYGDTDRDYHYFDVWNLLCETAQATRLLDTEAPPGHWIHYHVWANAPAIDC